MMLAAAATSVVAVVGGGRSVSACSCVGFTDEEALEAAETVFIGTLVDIVTPPGDTFSSIDPERFVFDVDQVYKGDAFVQQTIITARDGASCGLEITGPGPFLVFATRSDSIVTGAAEGELYSNLCSGTRAAADGAIPSGFGAGQPPVPAEEDGASSGEVVGDNSDGEDSSFLYWVLLAFAVVVIGLLGALLARRRPRTAGG